MILYFQDSKTTLGRKTSEIIITKVGRKWTYFTAKANNCKYRVDNTSGVVQIAPYWYTGKDMYLA